MSDQLNAATTASHPRRADAFEAANETRCETSYSEQLFPH